MKKTNEDRVIRVVELAEEHFGEREVEFVGLKYEAEYKIWVAKLKLNNFQSIYESAENSTEAIKKLKNRLKRIIKRYNIV